jgi:hypothetical protein
MRAGRFVASGDEEVGEEATKRFPGLDTGAPRLDVVPAREPEKRVSLRTFGRAAGNSRSEKVGATSSSQGASGYMIRPAHADAPSTSPRFRLLAIFLGSLSLAFSAACTHVAPYDRGRLAQPSMVTELESVASAHVHAVHEGAAGGGSVAESGCGCN